VARLILDSGAVIAVQRGSRLVDAYLATAAARGEEVVVPAVVVAETVRGGPADAPIHRLLRASHVPFLGRRLAEAAGRLQAAAGMAAAVDALVVAEAVRGGPCVLLTSDPGDLSRLAAARPFIRIVAVQA
jgi:hypothetical protein